MALYDLIRRRRRRYPWVFETRAMHGHPRHDCEACEGRANVAVQYEAMDGADLSTVFLCYTHHAVSKRSWTDVFNLINKKVGK